MLLILTTIVACAAIGALAFVALRSRLAPGPSLAERTVIVHTRRPDDRSIRGILVGHYADRVTLREAVYRHSSGDQDAGGLIHLPLVVISSIQEITEITETGDA